MVALAFGFIQTGPGRNLVRSFATDTLNGVFAGRFEIDALSGFIPFDVELEGVRLYDPDGGLVASLGAVRTELDPVALLDSTVALSNLTIDGPEVTLLDARGGVGLARALALREPPVDDGPSPWTVVIDRARLEDGSLRRIVPMADLGLDALSVDLALKLTPDALTWPKLEVHATAIGDSPLARGLGGPLVIATSGRLEGGRVVIDGMNVSAGPHAVEVTGELVVAPDLGGSLDIPRVSLDLDRLPPPWRERLGPLPSSMISGRGSLALRAEPDGLARAELDLDTPLGWVSTEVDAVIADASRLGDWNIGVRLLDMRPTDAMRQRLPEAVRDLRSDLVIEAHGIGLPRARPGDGGALSAGLQLVERHADPTRSGHLDLEVRRLPDDADRSIFELSVGLESLRLHPWLELAGETDLRVALPSVTLEGQLAWPRDRAPEVALIGSVEANVEGTLRALSPPRPVSLTRLEASFDGRWSGSGLPRAHVRVAGEGVRFDEGAADALTVGLELVESGGSPTLSGRIGAEGASWREGRIAALDMPLDVDVGAIIRGAEGDWGQVAVAVEGLAFPEGRVGKGRFSVGARRMSGTLALRGGLVGEGLGAGPSEVAGLDLRLEGALPTALWEAESGTVGATTVRLDGEVREPRVGARRASRVALDGLNVKLPLGRGGLRGVLGADGELVATGLALPEGAAESARLRLGAGAFLPTLALSGSAALEVREARLPNGERVERALLSARGLGTEVAFELDGVQPLEERRAAVAVKARGRATLPFKRDFALKLDALSMGRRETTGGAKSRTWLTLEDGELGTEWISVGSLELGTPYGTGLMQASGRFRPADGNLELKVTAPNLGIPAWLAHARDLWALVRGDIPRPAWLDHTLEGTLGMNLTATGTLSALSVKADLHGAGLTFRGLSGARFEASLSPTENGIDLALTGRWSADSLLEMKARLPATLSLQPARLGWHEDQPMHIDLTLLEPALSRALATLQTLVPVELPTGLDGSLDLDIETGGTPRSPTMSLALFAKRFVFGDALSDGTLVLDGSASHNATGFRLELSDARDNPQAQLDIQLPFALPRLLVVDDPITWAIENLENRSFLAELDLPDLVISDTPFASLLPDTLTDTRARVDLTLGGTLLVPALEGGVSLGAASPVPTDVRFELGFDTVSGGLIESGLSVQQVNGTPLLNGKLAFPSLSLLLRQPSRYRDVFLDPRLKLELRSAELRPSELWDLHPGLGDLVRTMFPDGRFMADIEASGSSDGLIASLIGTVETASEDGRERRGATRNIADRVMVGVDIGHTLEARASFTQEAVSQLPNLMLVGGIGITGAELLEGRALSTLPITGGEIDAQGFRLEGLAAAFRNVLGASGGSLDGKVAVTGTVDAPRFGEGLCAQFKPLDIVPLGLEEPSLALRLGFENGTRWQLDKAEACSSEPIAPSASGCALDAVAAGRGWRTSGFGLSLGGDIASLDPEAMSLEGCVRLEDYRALDTKTMKGRVDARLDLSGSVARPALGGEIEVVDARLAPALASRNVRPIGPPLDVHFVRGPPIPRPLTKTASRTKLPLDLDIGVSLPKDAIRIEPSMTLPLGEVRAVLYPYTPPGKTLNVRMRDGVMSLFGTIEVPRETVTLYGKNFAVDPDSRLVFRGDMANDPQLFFTARHNISYVDLSSIGLSTTNESEVVVRVTGTPLRPRLAFSSNPAMDETNILSVVALGVPAGGGAGLGEAVQSQLLTAMMGMATLQFARDFQRRLALDVVRVEARSMDPRETRLTVGKRLARDLMLYYDLDPSAREGDDVNAGSLEYRVSRLLSLLARAGDSNDISLELNLRIQDTPDAVGSKPAPTSGP